MATTKVTISLRELKAQAGKIVSHVEKTRQEVIITRRGKPCAKIVPVEEFEGLEKRPTKRTLRNAFPELPPLTDEGIQEIKDLWRLDLDE